MSAFLRATLSAAMVTTAVASCAYGTSLSPRADGAISISTFGYVGTLGPANWFSLNTTTNAACAHGTHQSPIDITGNMTEVAGSELDINIPDFTSGAIFENLGSTIEVAGESGTLLIPNHNKTFNLKQFHFHTPSEHLENGTVIPMEVHFVFQADDSEIAVLGVYIDIADETAASKKRQAATSASSVIETVFASSGEIATPGTATTTAALNMTDIVTFLQSTTFRTYSGSLTTPPCSEGVNWHVATDMLYVSLSSYKAARDVIGFNSRFAQGIPGEENALATLYKSMNA